ncbi:MAG TPA: Qat anti-phage system TatD family nuclease QatD [Fimbriimonadaceae bacterium]|nr:Qat anti-phage system TatD family nuclease QatD [Fimbriimonadaceae bacterium]
MRHLSGEFVDAHCHLDLYPDMEKVAASCETAQVATLAVTTTPRAWPRNRDLAAKIQLVEPALGLHPQLVADHASELTLWEQYLPEARFVGEVGLDASPRYYRSFEQQKVVFGQVLLACAEAGGKVLSIHSVRAATAVLDMVEQYLPSSKGVVILHWFTGTLAEVKRAIELDCYFSINRGMLQRPHASRLLRMIPLDRLLTETDGPFTHVNSRPCWPTDVVDTLVRLASCLGRDQAFISEVVQDNFGRLLVSPQRDS